MKSIISKMDEFPQRIIFAPGPRFEEEGYRWVLKSFIQRSRFSLSSHMGRVQKLYYPHLKTSFLSFSVSYPGYLMKGTLRRIRPWDFVLFDKQTRKLLHVKEQSSSERTPSNALGISREQEVSQVASHCKTGLILHTLPTHIIHSYGPLVELDQVDGREYGQEALSGIHDGSVDVFFYNIGDNSRVEAQVGNQFGVALTANVDVTIKGRG